MDNFDNYTEFMLSKIIFNEKKLLLKEETELASYPPGTLIVRRRNNKQYYYHRISKVEFGITNNHDLIYKLARKSYLIKSIKNRKSNLQHLIKCSQHILSNTSYTNSPAVPFNIKLSPDENNWLIQNSSCNPYKTDHLIYKTACGIFVRSKSERIIADKLFNHGIIFKYEAPMIIGDKTIYPDFTILRKDDKCVIWEHNGLMSNDDYFLKAVHKIKQYNSAGFYQHDNLICTEENDILDEKRLDEIIFRFILV